jgi:hypothetical protein
MNYCTKEFCSDGARNYVVGQSTLLLLPEHTRAYYTDVLVNQGLGFRE